MHEINLKSRSERELIIEAKVNASEETEELSEFRNGTPLPVIELSIDVPLYRMENCRTFTRQQELIAKKGLEASHFLKGQELSTVQSEQHEILKELVKKGISSVPLIPDVLREDGQRETILITRSGVVVSGNCRLSAMREIYAEEASVGSQFAYVKCQVLPKDITRDEIDDIEAFLQAGHQTRTRLKHDWIGNAQLVRRQLNKEGKTIKDVAEQLGRKESDIKKIVQSLEEADLYLREWVNKPGRYALVSDRSQQFFGDISKQLLGKDMSLQEASRAIAWSLFDNRHKLPGRLYSFNAAFGKLAEDVLKTLSEQLEIPITGSGKVFSGDDFTIDMGVTQILPHSTPVLA